MTPLDPDELEREGRRALALLGQYWRSLQGAARPRVTPAVSPGELFAALPSLAPEGPAEGEWDAIFGDLERLILPQLTHWQHPHFYAFFPANISTPAVIGELLAAGLGQQGMLWATSPACTELEQRVLDWLAEAMGLPASMRSTGAGGGVIQGTASEATLTALVAARARARRARATAGAETGSGKGASGTPHFTLYASVHAHSSVVKAAMIAGLADDPDDRTHVRLIEADPATHALRPDALAAALRADVAAGRTPIFVCATLGTTSSTALDPIDRVHDAITAAVPGGSLRPWVHVDAAHAGACLICPELRWMSVGVEQADSFCFNPHKWLLTNFDCDCFYVADRRSLIDALSVTPEYLRNAASDSGRVTDFRDWHVPLGRRFRALKLWLVLRVFGLESLRAYVREHNRLALWVEGRVLAEPRLVLAAPTTMNLVCFRVRDAGPDAAPADEATRRLHRALNDSGRLHLTQTLLPDVAGRPRPTLRMCIGAPTTQESHVREAWGWIAGALDDLRR